MAAIKRGLGKGLDIMIPEKISQPEINEENVSRETFLPIRDLEPNKSQPRQGFDEEALKELAASIKQYGVIQPIIVRKVDNRYEIIAGERRWRAARMAGLKEVPVIIKEYNPQEVMEIALIENIQREDLNPIEEALAYQKLIQEYNLRQEELAERVAKSRTAITNAIRLLKLDERVRNMVMENKLSGGHARALLSIENADAQYEAACKIVEKGLSVRDTEKLVKQLLKNNTPKKTAVEDDNSFIYRNLEERLKNIIGTKVTINRKQKGRGKIEIEYYSDDDLERIMELFNVLSWKA